jgi:hypothetical protein
MLKRTLFVAAVIGAGLFAAPDSHAQGQGSRQIAIEPAGAEAPGGEVGEAGTADTTNPGDDAPVAITPGNDADGSRDAVTEAGEATEKAAVEPPPTDDTEISTAPIENPLDPVGGEAPESAASEATAAPAATASPEIKVDSPDSLIVFLKSKGYRVDLDHKKSDGSYVLVVWTEKDHGLGYLLTVEHQYGKVTAREKIKLADYGYAAEEYGAVEDSGPAYESEAPTEDNNAYGGSQQDDADYGGGAGGSDY